MSATSPSPARTYSCPECNLCFAAPLSLHSHQRESKHAHCSRCNTVFASRLRHQAHMQSLHRPATQFRCCDCERDFQDEASLSAHLKTSKVHKPKKEPKKQAECKKCDRTFKNEGALNQHLASVKHHPLSNITCLASAKCKKRFTCPSAQLHHLESGTCPSGATRAKLNAALAAKDTKRIITSVTAVPPPMLSARSSPSTASASGTTTPILTPTSSQFLGSYPPSGVYTPTSTLAASAQFDSALRYRPGVVHAKQTCPLCPASRTRKFEPAALEQHLASSVHRKKQASWSMPPPTELSFSTLAIRLRAAQNSQGLACPMCPPSSTRRFKPAALEQHLLSSAHTKVSVPSSTSALGEISFHCPSVLMDAGSKKPAKNFSTVSGLTQHLESGACGGGKATLRRAVAYVQEEMRGMGFVGVRLLE